METSKEGLTSNEAAKRLAEYGRNELEEGEKKSLLVKFIEQFKDLMIIILLVAAVLSVVTSGGEDIADAIIILAVVIINAAFGVYQEGKAEEAIEALKSMSSPAARVLRDGHVAEVDSKELVPGDIVILEAGDVVPCRFCDYLIFWWFNYFSLSLLDVYSTGRNRIIYFCTRKNDDEKKCFVFGFDCCFGFERM